MCPIIPADSIRVSSAAAFAARFANGVTAFTLQLAANFDQRSPQTNGTNSLRRIGWRALIPLARQACLCRIAR